MSLIFDRFPSTEKAEAFTKALKKKFPQHRTHIWMDQGEMHEFFQRHNMAQTEQHEDRG